MKNSPVLITGVPRSGTSLTAGLIRLSGIFFGDTIPGNQNNPKGFHEHAPIRNQIIKPFLKKLHRDPMGQRPLPDPALMRKEVIPGLREKLETLLGVTKGERWSLKEPKLLLMAPPFMKALPDAQWVLVRREDEDILDSVMRTNFMRAYSTKEEWRPWMEYHLQRIEEIKRSSAPWIQFWPQKALDGDWAEVNKLEEFLGVKIPYREAMALMEPRFWHSEGHRSLYRGAGE